MEKKAYPKKGPDSFPGQGKDWQPVKTSSLAQRIFGLLKLTVGLSLLPFVYSSSVSFINEFSNTDKALQAYFWSGVISLLVIYLFVWEPAIIYAKGQKLLELIFNLFKPLVRIAPYLLPVYAIFLFILYWLLSLVFQSQALMNYFIFLFGFSMGLHLVFSAKSLRTKQGDFLKANYIFGFSFIYIINLILLSFCFNLLFKEFSFVNTFNNSFQSAKDIFYTVFKQLFLR